MTAPLARGAVVRVPKGTPIAREEADNTRTRADQTVAVVSVHEDRTGMLGQAGQVLVIWETRSGLGRWAAADAVELLDAGPHILRSGRKRTGGATYGRGGYGVVYKPTCTCGWAAGNTDRAEAHRAFAEHIASYGRRA